MVPSEIFKKSLTFDESFELAKNTNRLMFSDVNEDNLLARKTVIHALDNWKNIPSETHEIWTDLIESSGFYPYLAKDQSFLELNGLSEAIRKEAHHSRYLHGKYFHQEQQAVLEIFNSGKNLIVSAPTSFGKSLIIEEIIASNTYKNVIVIQPTLALLDETRKKLRAYKDSYKLILKTSQTPSESKGNIFLFTAERVVEYSNFPEIDLFIVDEFYKLSHKRKDERADVLNIAAYRVLKQYSPRFYMLGPNIDGVSKGFSEKYNAHFFKTDYSLVDAMVTDLYASHKDEIGDDNLKEKLLFKTIDAHANEQTLVYCSSPERARKLASRYLDHINSTDNTRSSANILALTGWLRQHIHPEWSLIRCLEAGIGIHDGALPRHVGASIIHSFNRSEIRVLFCTSTIIEGVNTSAKNILIFDRRRGNSNMDHFDHANISGRAGRMMVHYTGRVYDFNPKPKKDSVIVDIPFFEQDENVSSEILVQLQPEDVQHPDDEKYTKAQQVPNDERELFKKNAVSFWGQKALLDRIREDLESNKENIIWSGYADFDKLVYILGIAREYLAKGRERQNSARRLATLTNLYTNKKNIMFLVNNEIHYRRSQTPFANEVDLVDEAVRSIFQFQRHWLSYTIPKWLYVVDSLQQLACREKGLEPGNYALYAGHIENDFLDSHVSFLAEMGIPRSAIDKMKPFLIDIDDEEVIIAKINGIILRQAAFTEYERQKIIEALE